MSRCQIFVGRIRYPITWMVKYLIVANTTWVVLHRMSNSLTFVPCYIRRFLKYLYIYIYIGCRFLNNCMAFHKMQYQNVGVILKTHVLCESLLKMNIPSHLICLRNVLEITNEVVFEKFGLNLNLRIRHE